MNARLSYWCGAAVAGLAMAVSTAAIAGPVDVDFSPAAQVVGVGDIVEIHLIVSATGGGTQDFDALDAILDWDITFLDLLGKDDSNSGANFFVSDFLPDPDGINDDMNDGDALYTALAPAGSPVTAPASPGSLIVTTFQFEALAPTAGTDVLLIPTRGTFGETRVLLNGVDVTGNIGGPAVITIVIPAPGALALLGFGLITPRRRRRNEERT